ncbi:hypothetical protein HDV02_001048, partial [Globomyces sp. JEL0801]
MARLLSFADHPSLNTLNPYIDLTKVRTATTSTPLNLSLSEISQGSNSVPLLLSTPWNPSTLYSSPDDDTTLTDCLSTSLDLSIDTPSWDNSLDYSHSN